MRKPVYLYSGANSTPESVLLVSVDMSPLRPEKVLTYQEKDEVCGKV